MIRSLYDWVIRLAAHPRALVALGVLSFLESSVFPIPPDVQYLLFAGIFVEARKVGTDRRSEIDKMTAALHGRDRVKRTRRKSRGSFGCEGFLDIGPFP